MIGLRRLLARWSRWITSGLVVTLLFSQVAMAMYVCPKPDPRASVETTQMRATISMQQADKLPMSDCTGMPDSMDSEAPQLCHAHCSGDRESALSWQGLDIQFLAAHVM